MARIFGWLWCDDADGMAPIFATKWRSSKGFILFTVMFATFTEILLYGLLLPVIPTALQERAGIPRSEGQKWNSILLAIFCAARIVFSPIAGLLADRATSRRWPFIGGLIVSLIGTVLLCAGTHIALWILARLFQGISAAIVWAVGFAIIADTVPENETGRSMGYIGMCMTIGTSTGPLLGGAVYEHGGYYAVFAVAFSLLGLDIILRLVMVDKGRRGHSCQPVPDVPSANNDNRNQEKTSGATTPGLDNPSSLLSHTHASEDEGLTTEPTEPESPRRQKPAICILMTSVQVLVAIWVFFVVFLILGALDSVLPLFVEGLFGWKQTAQGLVFLPLALPHMVQPLIGYFNDRHPNFRLYVGAGGFLLSVPVLVLLRFVSENSLGHKVLLYVLLAIIGFCIAVVMPSFLAETSYIVQRKEEKAPGIFGRGGGMALNYGLQGAATSAGGIAGPFLGGELRENAGWDVMSWALAVVAGVSVVLVLLIPVRAFVKGTRVPTIL